MNEKQSSNLNLNTPLIRKAYRKRQTKETTIELDLCLDGQGIAEISTGLPFFDHMLNQLSKHGSFDLLLKVRGDLEVDAHHSVEDTGIAIGQAFADAVGDKKGIQRFSSISLPLDEALIDVALDVSGRPFLVYEVNFPIDTHLLGTPGFDPQLAEEFWRAFVDSAGITLHIRSISGRNTHHILEACFKAVARTLKQALVIEGNSIPSTKGSL